MGRSCRPIDSNAVTMVMGHGDDGIPCDFVMGSYVRVPGNVRDRVMQQDNGFLFLKPCNTASIYAS